MYNNQNQEIHTDYVANDIFKPINANQLAKAIHYDFVITQDMFNAYLDAHDFNIGSTLDVGAIVASNTNGSDGPFDEPIKAPCSLFIAANTNGYTLSFVNRLIGSSHMPGTGYIIDVADYQTPQGQYSLDRTIDMVNVYSSYPYQVSGLAGGINFWSTSIAPVILDNPGVYWDGVCKVGYYNLKSSFDMGARPTLQLVFSHAIGRRPTQSPTSGQCESGYTPAVVFADWMGSSGVTREYWINLTDTAVPGIFQSIAESYSTYGNEVVLNVGEQSSTLPYYATYRDPYEIRFTNSNTGKTVSISRDGTITWQELTSTTGSKASVVITDFSVPALDPNYETGILRGLTSEYGGKVSIFRDGTHRFITISEDLGTSNVDWYSPEVSSTNDKYQLFRFGSATTLDWYTWYAISLDYHTYSQHRVDWVYNPHRDLYIDAETLREGIVYEVRTHLLRMPIPTYEADGLHKTVGMQAIPTDDTQDPSTLDPNIYLSLWFYNGVKKTDASVKRWAANDSGNNSICLPWVSTDSAPYTHDSTGYSNKSISELGLSVVQFVKIGSDIYVLKY